LLPKQTCPTPLPRRSPEDLLCDGLPRQAAGPRFRFGEANPVAVGRSYAQSLFADLPYMVGVLVRWELHLTEAEWNCLHPAYWVAWTLEPCRRLPRCPIPSSAHAP